MLITFCLIFMAKANAVLTQIFDDAAQFDQNQGVVYDNATKVRVKDDVLFFRGKKEQYSFELNSIWGYSEGTKTIRYAQKKIYEVYEKDNFIIYSTPTKTQWEKRPASNCLSADPNNCMLWCLKEYPAKYFFSKKAGGAIRPLEKAQVEVEMQNDPEFLERLRKSGALTHENLNKI